METNETFEVALERFVAAVNMFRKEHYEKHSPKIAHMREIAMINNRGAKYIRVVLRASGAVSGSAYCFVEVATGNILKCDGWKGPAKGIRGSIFSKDFRGYGVDLYGANYAR